MEVRHIRAFEHQAEMKYKLYNKLSDEEYWEYLKYAYYGLWFNCNFRELAKSLYEHKIKDFIKKQEYDIHWRYYLDRDVDKLKQIRYDDGLIGLAEQILLLSMLRVPKDKILKKMIGIVIEFMNDACENDLKSKIMIIQYLSNSGYCNDELKEVKDAVIEEYLNSNDKNVAYDYIMRLSKSIDVNRFSDMPIAWLRWK